MNTFIQKIIQFFVSYDVFISVEEKDLKYAHTIRSYLRNFGARVFVYKLSIEGGRKWREEIKENLKDSHLYIVLLSSKSLKSKNVMLEFGGAYFSDKDILPVLIEKVNKKNLGMPDELQCVKYHDKDFFSNLKRKMFKTYIKRAIFWIILIGLIVYARFNGE